MGHTSIFQELSQYQKQLQQFLPKLLSNDISQQIDAQFVREKKIAYDIMQLTTQGTNLNPSQLLDSQTLDENIEVYDLIKNTCFLPKSQEIQNTIHLMKQLAERRWQIDEMQILSAYCVLVSERELQDTEIARTMQQMVKQLGGIGNIQKLTKIVQQMVQNYTSRLTAPVLQQKQQQQQIKHEKFMAQLQQQQKPPNLKNLLESAQKICNPKPSHSKPSQKNDKSYKIQQKEQEIQNNQELIFEQLLDNHFKSFLPLCEEQKSEILKLQKLFPSEKVEEILQFWALKQQRDFKLEKLATQLAELVEGVENLDFEIANGFQQTVGELVAEQRRLQKEIMATRRELTEV